MEPLYLQLDIPTVKHIDTTFFWFKLSALLWRLLTLAFWRGGRKLAGRHVHVVTNSRDQALFSLIKVPKQVRPLDSFCNTAGVAKPLAPGGSGRPQVGPSRSRG